MSCFFTSHHFFLRSSFPLSFAYLLIYFIFFTFHVLAFFLPSPFVLCVFSSSTYLTARLLFCPSFHLSSFLAFLVFSFLLASSPLVICSSSFPFLLLFISLLVFLFSSFLSFNLLVFTLVSFLVFLLLVSFCLDVLVSPHLSFCLRTCLHLLTSITLLSSSNSIR